MRSEVMRTTNTFLSRPGLTQAGPLHMPFISRLQVVTDSFRPSETEAGLLGVPASFPCPIS